MTKFRQAFGLVAITGVIVLGGLGLHAGANKIGEYKYPASEGTQYLTQKGYTDIKGGATDKFSACGKFNYAREYTARDPATGKTGAHTVCFSIFGPRTPLFGQ